MQPQPNSYLKQLQSYEPGLSFEQVAAKYGRDPNKIIKLASNENPLGPSPKALEALAKAGPESHRYPDQSGLIQALSDFYHVPNNTITLGNGSNELLDLIAKVYVAPGSHALMSQYAFAIYHMVTRAAGAEPIIAPAKNYGNDLTALFKAITPQTKLIWLANPNNPTGTIVENSELYQFIAKVPSNILVVLDEAYREYLPLDPKIDTTKWVSEFQNLIITRTFSKIYGLAGLRIGYAFAAEEITNYLNRTRQPFNCNHGALEAAKAALGDQAFVATSYEANKTSRQTLVQNLSRLGLICLPANGNFVTFEVDNGAHVNHALLEQGVIVRPLHPYGLTNWLRVTAGLPNENERFLAALAAVLEK